MTHASFVEPNGANSSSVGDTDIKITPLADLRSILPTVHAKLKDGHEWTMEAEEEFLRIIL